MTHEEPASSDVNTFRLICAIFGLLFLLLTQFGKLIYYEDRDNVQLPDFSQFYMGGLIAINGAWDSLYPIPDPKSEHNPGSYIDSTMRPRYEELGANAEALGFTRFIQPPPVALLLIPLALMPVDVSTFVWIFLQCVATWAISLQAATMFELCASAGAPPCGDPTAPSHPHEGWWHRRAGGLLILLVCLSPVAHAWIRVANVSPIIGWSIGVATLSLVRRRDAIGALALVLGGVTKYATLVLVPLYLAMRRWRAIIESIAMALVLLIVSLAIMGTDPYRVFIHDILPTFGRSFSARWNLSPTGMLLRIYNTETLPSRIALALRLTGWVVLALILVLIFIRPRRDWDRPANVFAAAATLVAWFLVFSPISWTHYFAYLAPFWGWMIFEATRSRPRLIAVVAAIGLCYLPLEQVPSFNAPEPFFSYPCFSLILTLVLTTWILFRDREPIASAKN